MKKQFVLLVSTALFIVSCSKESSDDDKTTMNINSFSVEQQGENLKFVYETDFDFEKYEISYVNAQYTSSYNNGTQFITTEDNKHSKPIEGTGLQSGEEYRFGIRGIYDINKTTEWFGAEYVTISEFCGSPYDLDFEPAIGFLHWDTDNNNTPASSFKVEYGEIGFELGTGTTETIGLERFYDLILEKGKTYDAYVKGYCNASLGWSDWVGPLSFTPSRNKNLCLEPKNLTPYTLTSSGNSIGLKFEWEDAGNIENFEYGFTNSYNGVQDATIYTTDRNFVNWTSSLTYGGKYNFYVRSVCLDGSKTAWVEVLDVEFN